jgi:integrase
MARAKRIPAPDDFRKFLEAIPDTAIVSADGARLIVITAGVAGLRVSEVLGLHTADIKSQAPSCWLGPATKSRRILSSSVRTETRPMTATYNSTSGGQLPKRPGSIALASACTPSGASM